jgi:N-6 DNA methylase
MGAWYTPSELVDHVVSNAVGTVRSGERVRVLDPACGDGRFLVAAARVIAAAGGMPVLTGVDIDLTGLRAAGIPRGVAKIEAIEADSLAYDWGSRRFDVVVGNPPFLSQMAAATARDGGSRYGGGTYANAAADFLALASRVAAGDGGRVGMVLPIALLTARDAGPIREAVAASCALRWFWSSTSMMFDAAVRTCAIGLQRGLGSGVGPRSVDAVSRSAGPEFEQVDPIVPPLAASPNHHWGWLIADAAGVPPVPPIASASTMSDHALVTANFRDQYYGLVGAVADDADGPPLITTGVIDIATCLWGQRPTRFAKQRFVAPRVDRAKLAPFMQRWAERCLVPKVLVATQSRVIEAVVDDRGEWLPAVPVIRLVPNEPQRLWEIAAVLTSPIASALIAEQSAGSGLSATTVRVSQRTLGLLPWPTGDLTAAVAALRASDIAGCGRAIDDAFGVDDQGLFDWWHSSLSHD